MLSNLLVTWLSIIPELVDVDIVLVGLLAMFSMSIVHMINNDAIDSTMACLMVFFIIDILRGYLATNILYVCVV
ncbi:MAG: hypothetical protein KAH10_04190 [Flavobacteriales bacterium]|nr:hypothetical protein [Flavobacteriales bacterium]